MFPTLGRPWVLSLHEKSITTALAARETQRRIHALSGAVNATATGERISGSSAANIEWQKRADALKRRNSVLALAMQTPHENSRPPPRDPTTSNRIL